MSSNETILSNQSDSEPDIHTMQDDLAQVSPPSRFDLRHRRPLPKSERMEDLRGPFNVHEPQEDPLSSRLNPGRVLQAPIKEQNILSDPVFLWIVGLGLTFVLFGVIVAIVASLLTI